nr:MAG TPA: hypothetical protein [Bacteriophage sp.]
MQVLITELKIHILNYLTKIVKFSYYKMIWIPF